LQSFFKKKKEKEKLPRSAQSFNLFCQIVIFFHKHMKKQECSSQANFVKQVASEKKMWACNFPLVRRVNQVFFEGTFFNQVAQGRTELGVHT
jgi:hypothetical protein